MNMQAYYRQLVGAKVTKFQMVQGPHDLEPYTTYWVKDMQGNRLKLEVSRDAEGNGPVFCFISPDPQKKGH